MKRSATLTGPGTARSPFSHRLTVRISLSRSSASSACVLPSARRAAANSWGVMSIDRAKLGDSSTGTLANDFGGGASLDHKIGAVCHVALHVGNARLLRAGDGKLKPHAEGTLAGAVSEVGGDEHVFHVPCMGPMARCVK